MGYRNTKVICGIAKLEIYQITAAKMWSQYLFLDSNFYSSVLLSVLYRTRLIK